MKITCKEATYLSAKAETRKLGLYSKVRLLLHQLLCPPCRRFVVQARLITHYFKQIKPKDKADLGYKLSEQTKERIKKHIDENYKY